MACVNFFLSFCMENYYNTCPEKITLVLYSCKIPIRLSADSFFIVYCIVIAVENSRWGAAM